MQRLPARQKNWAKIGGCVGSTKQWQPIRGPSVFSTITAFSVAFRSDIADAARQQSTLTFNNPAPTTFPNAAQIFERRRLQLPRRYPRH